VLQVATDSYVHDHHNYQLIANGQWSSMIACISVACITMCATISNSQRMFICGCAC